MGFVPLEHEYKLMGMAPYASDRAAEEVARIFQGYLGLDDSGLGFQRHGIRRTRSDMRLCRSTVKIRRLSSSLYP